MKKRARTEKSKYKHQSTGDHCTCAAYVAEIMCMRNAEHKNQGSLPFKFWNIKPWNWTFKRQVYVANKLIKDYSDTALVKAIHSQEFFGIFSLNNPKVIPIIKKFHLMEEEAAKHEKQILDVRPVAKPRKTTFGKRSKFNQLRELDANQEEEDSPSSKS